MRFVIKLNQLLIYHNLFINLDIHKEKPYSRHQSCNHTYFHHIRAPFQESYNKIIIILSMHYFRGYWYYDPRLCALVWDGGYDHLGLCALVWGLWVWRSSDRVIFFHWIELHPFSYTTMRIKISLKYVKVHMILSNGIETDFTRTSMYISLMMTCLFSWNLNNESRLMC